MKYLQRTKKDFYNKKGEFAVVERSFLSTKYLRIFHNWIKSVLIGEYSFKAKKYGGQFGINLSVLDIACGKGGDLFKWGRQRIGHYVGMDIARQAVTDAHARWSKRKSFPAQFIELDCSSRPEVFCKYIPKHLYFDIVSCQMSLHYMFEKKQLAWNFFQNISKKLTQGGFFIATIPDSNVIVKRLRKYAIQEVDHETEESKPNAADSAEKIGTGEAGRGKKAKGPEVIDVEEEAKKKSFYRMGNDFYSIKIDNVDFPPNKAYGLEYGFYLSGAVGDY